MRQPFEVILNTRTTDKRQFQKRLKYTYNDNRTLTIPDLQAKYFLPFGAASDIQQGKTVYYKINDPEPTSEDVAANKEPTQIQWITVRKHLSWLARPAGNVSLWFTRIVFLPISALPAVPDLRLNKIFIWSKCKQNFSFTRSM